MQGQHSLEVSHNISAFISQTLELPIHTLLGAFLIKSTTIHPRFITWLPSPSRSIRRRPLHTPVLRQEKAPAYILKEFIRNLLRATSNQTVNVLGGYESI
jgi:hypothetical protein